MRFPVPFISHEIPVLTLLSLPLFITACSGEDSVSPMRSGVFLDSAVSGLTYETETQRGTTDSDGTYNYIAGESITFSIGEFELPTVRAASITTPLDIFSSDDINATPVANLSRLLQSMDNDRDPENGLDITAAAVFSSATQLDFSDDDFDSRATALLQDAGLSITTLVETATATAHLQQTLFDNDLVDNNNTALHRFVGRQAAFNTRFYNVSGNLTVLDDRTIEVRNFNYDGQGPAVYFYAAKNRAYDSNEAFIIGSRLNGQVYVNDTLRLRLPDSRTLDDFDSLSVWCADVRVDFGDVFFGDL